MRITTRRWSASRAWTRVATIALAAAGAIGGAIACSSETFSSAPGDAEAPSPDGSTSTDAGASSDATTVVCEADASFAFDVDNCGRCGRRCGALSQCVEGVCSVAVIGEIAGPVGLWITDNEIYATGYDTGGGVYRYDKSTLAGGRIVAQRGAWDLVRKGDFVYWTNWEGTGDNGGLWSLELGKTTAARRLSLGSPRTLERDSEGLYLVNDYQRAVAAVLDTAPNTITEIAGSSPNDIFALAVDTHYAYWTVPLDNAIRAAPKRGGGSARVVRSDAGAPASLLVDGDQLYVASWVAPLQCAGASVTRSRLEGDGGIGETKSLSATERCPGSLVSHKDHVYWSEFTSGGSIKRMHKNKGTIEEIVTGRATPGKLRVDDRFVYFTEISGRKLSRVALP